MPASVASSGGETIDEFYYNPEEDYMTDFTPDQCDIQDPDLVSDDEFLWDYRYIRGLEYKWRLQHYNLWQPLPDEVYCTPCIQQPSSSSLSHIADSGESH